MRKSPVLSLFLGLILLFNAGNVFAQQPVINGQIQAISIDEDQSVQILLDYLDVTDPDNTYPDDHDLIIQPGSNYSFTGQTITPALNWSGTLSVWVTVSDGVQVSAPFAVSVVVDPVNDSPVAVNDNVVTNQGTPISIPILSNDTDIDNGLNPSSVVIISGPIGGSYSVSSGSGIVTYSPNSSFNGFDNLTYTVRDISGATSNIATISIEVKALNAQPTINDISNVSVQEDASAQLVTLTGITDGGSEGQILAVSASSNNPSLFSSFGISYSSPASTGTLQFTPASNMTGTATITVTVTDNGSSTPPAVNTISKTFTITIVAVNDAPTLDAISNVAIDEDAGPQTVALSGITDGDSGGQTLVVTASSNNNALFSTMQVNYSGGASATLNYTPAPGANGSATVTVTVTDDGSNSAPHNNTFSRTFMIAIASVNDAPTLAAIGNVTVNEDAGPQTIPLSGISDGDAGTQTLTLTASNTNNALFSAFSLDYTAGAMGSLHYTPVANASGSASVTILVTDNGSNTAPHVNVFSRTFTISVSSVNDAPTISPVSSVIVNEDVAPQVIMLTGITDGDSGSQSLTVNATNDNNALFSSFGIAYSGGTSGAINFTPAPNTSGVATVTITVTDNGSNSAPNVNTIYTVFTITVTPVNDPPTLNVLSPVTILEDTGPQVISLSGITDGGLEGQVLTVAAINNNSSLFNAFNVSYGGGTSGSINFTPIANVSGVATITVTVTDNGSNAPPNVNSFSRTFTLTITPVDDPPFFNALSNITVDEDAPIQTMTISGISPGPLESQTVSFMATSSNPALVSNPTVSYNGTGATGSLSFQPVSNQSGTTTITLVATDQGGQAFSRTFTITVNGINDQPTLTAISPITVLEDSGPISVPLTGISAGGGESQPLTLQATSDNPGLFQQFSTAYLSPSTTGTLMITPAANASGPTTITVTVQDNGSNISPHANSITRTFTFNVTPQNDPPTFASLADVFLNEDEGLQTATITGISEGPGEDQTINFTASSSNTGLIPHPNIIYDGVSPSATLQYQPNANQSGVSTITVTATDDQGGTFFRTFLITVNSINDVPTLDPISNRTIDEDAPIQTIALTGISAGPSESQDLTLTAVSDNPSLFQSFVVNYTSPSTSGSIDFLPAANATGTATVTVSLRDNGSNSGANQNSLTRTFMVTVSPVNDPPIIVSQNEITISEDQTLTLSLSDIQFTDVDNSSNFTIAISNGSNYTVSGMSIIPALNFYGNLSIPVTVNDGSNASNPYPLQVTVSPVNDKPQIIGQNPINIGESEAVDLSLNHLTIMDPDDVYPDDFTMSVLGGSNYSVTGNTVTPIANFSGTLSVPVFVNDGQTNSDFYQLQIQVNSVNDPPMITGQATTLNMIEEGTITLQVLHLNITDPDNTYPNDFVLSVLPGSNYTFTGRAVTPIQNFDGTLQVSVSVSDGQVSSSPFTMQINVTPVNDQPQITGQQVLSTNEDQPLTLKLSDINVEDPDNEYPDDFSLAVSAGPNYTVSGLTIIPANNYTGTLTVSVRVNDGLLNSANFNLQVQVSPSNDPPAITGQLPSTRSINEDESFTIGFDNLVVVDPDNTYPTEFSLVILSGSNYTFSGNTVTPVKDFTGLLTVQVAVNDGTNNSLAFGYKVQVVGTNDPPVVVGQNNLTVSEDQSILLKLEDLLVTDPDNTYPTGFSLTVLPGSNYSLLNQTVIPDPNFYGTLSVPVIVNDGQAASVAFPLQIQVLGQNDPPSFDSIGDVILPESAPPMDITITNITAGPLESQPLYITATSGNTALLANPVIVYDGSASTATMTLVLNPDHTGSAVVEVKVVDPGLAEYVYAFTVLVENINDAPTIAPIDNIDIDEDSGPLVVSLSGITAGPLENQVLSVTAVGDNAPLIESIDVIYQSPQTVGELVVTPTENGFGTVEITVTVTDDGSGDGENENATQSSFVLTVHPVEDNPIFISSPVLVGVIGDDYTYSIEASDVDPGSIITITTIQKPNWLSLSSTNNGMATLTGTPANGDGGAYTVVLEVSDENGNKATQSFELQINTRPIIQSLAMEVEEDVDEPIDVGSIRNAFTDADGDAFQLIRFTKLPNRGRLRLGGAAISTASEITEIELANLYYDPEENFFGLDTISWIASDGKSYALDEAKIFVKILPVNDPPQVLALETVPMVFEVGQQPQRVSLTVQVADVDSDSLVSAEISFRRQHFVVEEDWLEFDATERISGSYNPETGILTLTGKALLSEYNKAISSIRYYNLSELFFEEAIIKTLTYVLNDGQTLSTNKDRQIKLIDSFEDLRIPNGFTPDNREPNNTWTIRNIDKYVDAVVTVYSRTGQMVFRSEGEYEEWDGTYQGTILPVDSYYYTIDLNLPSRVKTYRGTVLILR